MEAFVRSWSACRIRDSVPCSTFPAPGLTTYSSHGTLASIAHAGKPPAWGKVCSSDGRKRPARQNNTFANTLPRRSAFLENRQAGHWLTRLGGAELSATSEASHGRTPPVRGRHHADTAGHQARVTAEPIEQAGDLPRVDHGVAFFTVSLEFVVLFL